MYSEINQIRFKTPMLRSSLCDYSNAYILVKETVTVAEETDAAPNNSNKKVIFKNCAAFTNCISGINNTLIDGAHDIEVVMPMCNLIEYSDSILKISGILWKYCRDEPALADDNTITDFNENYAIADSFKIQK